MKHLTGLLLAVLLGIAAAGMNWVWMSGLATPDEYVALKTDVSAGDELSDTNLVSVPVPGNTESLRQSLVLWQDRAVLFGTRANRNYLAGDMVFHRDLQPPEQQVRWDVIGPFKLISVGERFKERTADEMEFARTDGNTLTIAVDANFDERTKRLLEVIRSDRSDGNLDSPQPGIVAVQVLPPDQKTERRMELDPANIVYQTVSLDGIANVPRVLLEGDRIRFVIPARPKY